MDSTNNPFAGHEQAILIAASARYSAEKAGQEADETASRVNILPENLGDMSEADLGKAKLAEAKMNVAARCVARLALLSDTQAKGGIRGLFAGAEIIATRVFEKPYAQEALKDGGMVDKLLTDQTYSA